MTRRQEMLAKQNNKTLLSAFEKYRKLTVEQMLELAERYVLANAKTPWLQKLGRKMPVNERAFHALHNMEQWGDCKCR